MSVIESMAPKRIKVKALGHGLGSVWQRGEKFEHVYIDKATGRQVCKTLEATTKSLALREASGRLEKIERGEVAPPSRMTFDELAEDFFSSFAGKVASGTKSPHSLDAFRRRYRVHLQPLIGRERAQAITRARALRLLDNLHASKRSPATISGVWRTFVRILNHGVDRGLIGAVDLRLSKGERIEVEPTRKVWTGSLGQIASIIACVTILWRPLIETAAQTGARISELLGLTWADVDLSAGTISITKQLDRLGNFGKPKTRNGHRVIEIGEQLRRSLTAHYLSTEDKRPEAFVFGQHTAPAGRYRLVARAFEKAVSKAGIEFDAEKERVSIHCLRHSAATRLTSAELTTAEPDLGRVAAYLGDSLEVVIGVYLHALKSEAKSAENRGEMLSIPLMMAS